MVHCTISEEQYISADIFSHSLSEVSFPDWSGGIPMYSMPQTDHSDDNSYVSRRGDTYTIGEIDMRVPITIHQCRCSCIDQSLQCP